MKLIAAALCVFIIFVTAVLWPRSHHRQLEGFTSLIVPTTPIPDHKLKRCIVTYGNYRKYLQTLAYYLVPQKRRGDFDEWIIFMSSSDPLDINYVDSLATIHDPWIKIYESGKSRTSTLVDLCNFTTDPNTVYLKLDHTVLWIQDDFVRKLLDARLQSPHPFLVIPNVINPSDPQTHRAFLADLNKRSIISWHTNQPPQHTSQDYYKMNVPAAAYFGRDLKDTQLSPGTDVEQFLTVDFPKKHERPHMTLALPVCANYGIIAEDVLKGYLAYLRMRVVEDASK